MYGYQTGKTDNERYLEGQVQELKAEQERDHQRQQKEREERMREYREASEAYQRSADNWPEALSKQAYLFQREANQWPTDDPDFPDDYFGPGAEACKRALVIWREIEASKQPEIAKLQARIRAIRDGIRLAVAEKLETESNVNGWQHVADALREYNDSTCDAWLDW